MHISEFSESIPERSKQILKRVEEGTIQYGYTYVDSIYNNHVANFKVFSDALKIDGYRVNVTAEDQQKIADILGCSLLTAKLSDMIWDQARIRVSPCIRPITSSVKAMLEHSTAIDKKIGENQNTKLLISTVGKDWIIDNTMNSPGKAINHGWHFEGASCQGIAGNINPSLLKNPKTKQYWKLIQAVGTRHGSNHSDYSQVCRLVKLECIVDGKSMLFHDLLRDKELAPLASHCGPIKNVKQI